MGKVSQKKKEEFTGRYIMVLDPTHSSEEVMSSLQSDVGLNLKSSTDFENEIFSDEDLNDVDGIILDKIGVAILNETPKNKSSISTLQGGDSYIVEPERIVEAVWNESELQDYVKGYRDATNRLSSMILDESDEEPNVTNYYGDLEIEDPTISTVPTWGLNDTRVTPRFPFYNPFTGLGIKVAILDTGFEQNHPDFSGRNIVQRSFVPGQAVQDGNGHGTHCTGTACGPLSSTTTNTSRYGVAYKSDIFIGKVLSNQGRGRDGWILAGINWAIANNVHVVSMSLGARTNSPGYSRVYENVAANALRRGTLIIAAAGNDSNRPNTIRPVSHPANCPSIMAVGAIDENAQIATFSNGGLYPSYGAIDIVAPGVNVFSSYKLPEKYRSLRGTSMAAPHVAGIAALWAQSNGLRGRDLWKKLTSTAKALPHPVRDDGAGLVQAPVKRFRWDKFPFPFPPAPKVPFPPIPRLPL